LTNVITTDLVSIDNSSTVTSINNNIQKLRDEFDKVVYKDGREEFTGNIDANGKRIINLPDAVSNQEPITLNQLEEAVAAGVPDVFNESLLRIAGDNARPTSVSLAAFNQLQRTPEQFGAIANDIINDTVNFKTSALSGPIKADGTYSVNGLEFTTNAPIRIEGKGTIRNNTNDQSCLAFNPQGTGNQINGLRVVGLRLKQKQSPNLAAGLLDDFSAIKIKGSNHGHFENLDVSDSDVGFSIQFGDSNLGDRQNYNNNAIGIFGSNMRGMGFECFGSQGGSFTGFHFAGDNGVGAPGLFHALRVHAFSFAQNIGNLYQVYGENFATAASFQQYGHGNTAFITGKNCTRGIEVHGFDEAVPTAALHYNETIYLDFENGTYGIYDGGGINNTFYFNLRNCGTAAGTNGSIRALAYASGATGNTYSGTVAAGNGRLAWISNERSKLNLDLIGVNTTASVFGLLLDGNYATGRVLVRNCSVGAQISGSNNNLKLDIDDCTTALTISGNNNIITCNVDGNVTITGNNNILLGQVTGTITNSGTGNNLSGLNPKSGTFTGTTDASGFVTFTHNLGRIPQFVSLTTRDNANRSLVLATSPAMTSTQATVRVFSGPAAPLVSTSTTFLWKAE
jgi:hypothetical protein